MVHVNRGNIPGNTVSRAEIRIESAGAFFSTANASLNVLINASLGDFVIVRTS
jgi:hypothetical protein